ncbi:hypothetical protein D910_10706 [Dendroctonus ponderosae]|uniref:Structural maintenance of chromosomes protein 5 n=1 Tax=Dendroctonus ponderosae TaxID=77166 RepID=U4UHG1_DENPD|nr:hypothetical protein D910_10706 [Dendroctonus ponderosae]
MNYSLDKDDLLEKQQSLIEARAKHRSLLEQLNKHTQNLQESHDANCRLEGKVKNFNEMKKYKEMIADIDRQIAWIEYEDKRDKLTEIKKDKQSAQAIYDKYRQEMKPLEKEIHAHRASLNDFQQKNSKITQNIRNKEGLINTTIEKMEALMSKVRHFEDEMNTKLAECEQWDKQIQEATVKLEDSKKVYRTLLKKVNQGYTFIFQDEHESQEIFKHITRCTDRKRQLQDQRDLIEQDRLAKKASIKALQYEQSKIENVKQIRFEQLRKLNKDAYSAVLWLRENKDKFKGEIFEPIMLELNVLDKSKSKYVESLVPFRDRLAFTCTDKYDMNLFIGYIRKQQGLSVNVLHSGPNLNMIIGPNGTGKSTIVAAIILGLGGQPKTVGRGTKDDLLEKQQSLIEARAKHRSLLEQLNKHTQNLQESHDANCRLEGKVKNFNEMKKYKEMIADIDRQIAWIEYEDKRDKLTEIKKDKQSAQAIYDKYRQEMKPLEKEIHAHRASLNDFQQKNSKITQNIRNKEGLINTTIEKMEALMSKVRHFEDEMNTKLAECEQWDKQIQEATVKLEDSKKVYRTLLKKVNQGYTFIFQDEHESQEIFKHITRCTDRKRQLQDQRDLIEQDRLAKKASIKALQYEQSKIENVKQIRFEQLRKLNKDAYSAVLWLRENKDKFKGEIFEPIMLELNVLDKSKSKYVESLVPFRDRLAFTCTDKYDMNLFIGYIRKQQGLSVNVLHSGLYEKTKRELEYLESQLSNYDIQIEKNDDELKLHKDAIKEIRTQTQQADTLKNKIAAGEERLKQMSESKKEPEAIRNEARHKMKKLIQTMGVLQDSINSCFKELALSMTQNAINSVNVEVSRQKVEYFDNQIVDLRRLMEEAGETLNLVVDRYNAAMQAAKAQLQKAKSLSNGFTPADDGFDKFRQRAKSLGDNIEQLSAEKENINSRIACLNTADDTEIKEYEDRKNRIEKLGQNIDTINSDINKVSSKMERLHEAWLTPLNDLIAEINLKFGSAFERMGCAGEVGICQGDDEKNYEDYGISIKVTYRNGELLQELNAVVQSGGERAVATAAFMLALQELTPVPFRCVDEINQGLLISKCSF